MSKINIFLLVIAVISISFSIFQLSSYEGGIIETSGLLKTDKGYDIPYLKVEDTDTVPFATALLIHDKIANKTSMKYIATSLAHLGVDTYAIDLPGHGESSELHSDEILNDLHSVSYFYHWLENNDKILNDNMIFIGNSKGGDILLKVSMSRVGLNKSVKLLNYSDEQFKLHEKYLVPKPDTMILISSFPREVMSNDNYKNVFVINESFGGEWRQSRIKSYMESIKPTFTNSSSESDVVQITKSKKFKSKTYPRSNGLSIIYLQDVTNDISKWIVNYYKVDLATLEHYNFPVLRNLLLISILFGFFISIFPITNILSRLWVFDFKRAKEPYKIESFISVTLKKVISLIFSSCLSILFVLLGFIHLELTSLLATIFIYQFIIDLFLFRNYIFTSAKYDSQVFSKILLSLIMSVVLYFLISIIGSLYISDIMLTSHRVWRFLVVYIVFVLYFVSDEFFFRTPLVRYNSDLKTYLKSFIFYMLDKFIILFVVFFISQFSFGMDITFVIKYLVILSFLIVLLQIISIYIFRLIKSYYVTGFLNAFILSWILSVIPVLV